MQNGKNSFPKFPIYFFPKHLLEQQEKTISLAAVFYFSFNLPGEKLQSSAVEKKLEAEAIKEAKNY